MTNISSIPKSLDKSKIKILLLEGIHQSAIDCFAANGYENVEHHKTSLVGDDLISTIASAHFVGIRSRTKLDQRALKAAEKLTAIGCFCIGTDQVDLSFALEKGVPVFNAPFSNTRSVAELVLAEAILLMRGIPEKNALAHQGQWQKTASGANEIRGKSIGIIGYGNIGSQVSVLAESLGMEVKFTDTINRLPLGKAKQVDLDQLLKTSDVISLHVPQATDTVNLLGAREIDLLNSNAVVINASRGNVVDIDALANALKEGKLRGAAVDVFPVEPKSTADKFHSPLQGLNNVILTPHIGGSTEEAQYNIGIEVADRLAKYSDTGASVGSVNFPQVTLPAQEGKHRLLHIHQNRPGTLTAINQIFSDHQINIAGQFLQTHQSIGYVVFDVDSDYSELALAKLKQIEGTIRCRILW